MPEAGDLFEAVEDERLARELAEQRIAAAKEKQFSSFQKVTLDNLFSQMAQNDMKELAIVVKADVQGSAEAVKQTLEKISNDEVRVRVIHAGVGAISEVRRGLLADASNAIIIGFNVRPDNVAKEEAAATKVEMRMYRVIYDAINDDRGRYEGYAGAQVPRGVIWASCRSVRCTRSPTWAPLQAAVCTRRQDHPRQQGARGA